MLDKHWLIVSFPTPLIFRYHLPLTRNFIMARLYVYTEICGGYARKSSELFYNSAPKVEQYYLQNLTYSLVWTPNTILHTTSMPIITSQQSKIYSS